jgi:hypothetical protein
MFVAPNANRPGLKMLAAQARERNIREAALLKAQANAEAHAKVLAASRTVNIVTTPECGE